LRNKGRLQTRFIPKWLRAEHLGKLSLRLFQSGELAACLLRVRHIGHGVSDRQHATTQTSYSCFALPLRVDRLRLTIARVDGLVAARGPRPNFGISMCNAAKV